MTGRLRTFRVGAPSAGTRLDLFLAAACSDLSRSRIQKLIAEGAVRVDGGPARRAHHVHIGEEVTVEVAEPREVPLEAEAIPLSVLYEDGDLLAIDKPPGLVVHPAPGHPSGTLVNALLHHVRDLAGIGGEMRPGIVHRLDRNTSGVLLVAKTDRAHQLISRQMRKRTLKKEYLAVVAGVPRVRKGEVTLAIGRDPKDRKRMKAFRAASGAAGALPAGIREARTLYEIEREWPALGVTLLRCRLVTGRTHQIRVHLAAAGLPVVGDPVYGRARFPKVRDAALRKILEEFPRQALHAERVAFHHPATQQLIEVVAPVPADMRELIHRIESE
ncbi:MAG TPA: RluA family pseudouridine synthase [Thermoanaerobaculia bacterium]|nr:RluA family pseudouridine synthase [Thermoanaerobaculia bacterium]